MDSKALIELLDLKGARAGPGTGPALVVSEEGGSASEPASPTALHVDGWGLRRGQELLAASERLKRLSLDGFAVADCHAVAFDPDPTLSGRCVEPARRQFFATLLETPEYRALHGSTRLDANASEIAAVHFAEAFDRFRLETAPKETKSTEGAAPALDREVAAIRAVGRAVSAASREVTECREATKAFGMWPGSPGGNDVQAIAALFRRVRGDPALLAICTLAGRYRRLAQARQRRKVRHGLDDMVGVDLGGDLSRVLPHELAKLVTPPMDVEALRRFVERQLMSREHRAIEPVGKGPIIVCLDESGSMEGEPIQAAKAIALAMAWIARSQRRWAALVAYSGDSGERILPLSSGRWDEQALADWLSAFIGRGSTLDVPVREMPRIFAELYAPVGDTDVVFITDCACRIPETTRDAFMAWKRSVGARLITLVVSDDAGDLRAVSDETHLVHSLDIREEGVAEALSI